MCVCMCVSLCKFMKERILCVFYSQTLFSFMMLPEKVFVHFTGILLRAMSHMNALHMNIFKQFTCLISPICSNWVKPGSHCSDLVPDVIPIACYLFRQSIRTVPKCDHWTNKHAAQHVGESVMRVFSVLWGSGKSMMEEGVWREKWKEGSWIRSRSEGHWISGHSAWWLA